jgi:hypothetical protein
MVIERSGFLLAAVALAGGGYVGWSMHESKTAKQSSAAPMPTAEPAAKPETVIVVEHVPALPACDDSVGTAEACPFVGPSDEGLCSNIAAIRCNEFKLAFKPRVAQAAVACLRSLKGNELCDATRVNLCGHRALMAACPDPAPPAASDAGMAPAASAVALACENIVKSCASVPPGPTPADCRQTLSGMSDVGRATMTTCVTTHCADRGLLGCEAKKI